MLNRSYDYESQIAHLTENPNDIKPHWSSGLGLFKLMGTGLDETRGCPTIIRNNENKSLGHQQYAFVNGVPNHEFTEQLSKDTRIPKSIDDVTVEHLPIFAEWQEKYDELVSAAKQTQTT